MSQNISNVIVDSNFFVSWYYLLLKNIEKIFVWLPMTKKSVVFIEAALSSRFKTKLFRVFEVNPAVFP